MIEIVVSAALTSSCMSQAAHSRLNVALAIELTAAIACDVGQTHRALMDPNVEEYNPIVGPHPSNTILITAGVTTIAAVWAMALIPDRWFPKELTTGALTMFAAGESYNVSLNAHDSGRDLVWCGRYAENRR
jgi:hypothetical protein